MKHDFNTKLMNRVIRSLFLNIEIPFLQNYFLHYVLILHIEHLKRNRRDHHINKDLRTINP